MRLHPSKTHHFTGKNVPWLLANQAEIRPDHVFIRWEPFEGTAATWTYREFADEVARVAGGLSDRGISTGDHVVIHLGNCPEFLVTWFACSHLGAVAVTTNTRSTTGELEYFLTHCEAVAVVTQPALLELVQGTGVSLRFVAVTSSDQGAAPSLIPGGECVSFEELRHASPVPAVDSDALAANSVQYTSGTTARPKGVLWTHANALWGAKTGASVLGLGPNDVTLAFLPLFHTNALSYTMLSTLWSGGTVVVQPRFSASRYWPTVIATGCTWTSSIPFMLTALMSQPRPGAHQLRFLGLGASDVPIVQEIFGLPTIGWFGMTETITVVLVSSQIFPNHRGAMGSPVSGYEVAVVDDANQPVAFGQSGWLKIRGVVGVALFAGYLHNDEATESAFDEDGWFTTGDLVTPFADGDIRFDNRGGDMLRVGAENVSAAEVERVIATVPGVRESAVVAAPDPMLDEVPVAFVIAWQSDEALPDAVITACGEQLAAFKVPREVIVVSELPRVTLGKIDKKSLRAWLAGPRSELPPTLDERSNP